MEAKVADIDCDNCAHRSLNGTVISKWVSVDERLPLPGLWVLVLPYRWNLAKWIDEWIIKDNDGSLDTAKITHWMELPAPL